MGYDIGSGYDVIFPNMARDRDPASLQRPKKRPLQRAPKTPVPSNNSPLTEQRKREIDTKWLKARALDRLPKGQRPKKGESLAACFLNADLVGCIPHNRVLREEVERTPALQKEYNRLIRAYEEEKRRKQLMRENWGP